MRCIALQTVRGLVAAEVAMKEGSKLLGRQEYAKRVALDLYRFMEVCRSCSITHNYVHV